MWKTDQRRGKNGVRETRYQIMTVFQAIDDSGLEQSVVGGDGEKWVVMKYIREVQGGTHKSNIGDEKTEGI